MSAIQRLQLVCIGVCSTLTRHEETAMRDTLREALDDVEAAFSSGEILTKAEAHEQTRKALGVVRTKMLVHDHANIDGDFTHGFRVGLLELDAQLAKLDGETPC